ncbi:MAG: lipoyl(octanoyl) transferase LipB [Leptospira sp.]|nr:lipoyl(octanoyl) transferase LipB [Leptospira sp.]
MRVTEIHSFVPYSSYDRFQESLRQKRREILLFLEHSPSITAGINYNIQNLLVSREFLEKKNISLSFIRRGGDFTAHEPGQLVLYPHIDLKKRNIPISRFTEIFLGSMIDSMNKTWGLRLIQRKDKPGLYLEKQPDRKLVSMGIYFKSFFTSFGAAINIRNDLNTFQFINPCGQDSSNMVSVRELGLDDSKEDEFIREFKGLFLQYLAVEN